MAMGPSFMATSGLIPSVGPVSWLDPHSQSCHFTIENGLHGVLPLKDRIHFPLEPLSRTLLGNRAFADAMSSEEVGVSPQCNGHWPCFLQDRQEEPEGVHGGR